MGDASVIPQCKELLRFAYDEEIAQNPITAGNKSDNKINTEPPALPIPGRAPTRT
jgi:hypothetical protein